MIETSAVFYTASDGAGYISKMKMQGFLFKTQGEKCQLKYKNSELFSLFCGFSANHGGVYELFTVLLGKEK